MAFSPSEIAFEGFRLTREKPAVIGWWSLAREAGPRELWVTKNHEICRNWDVCPSLNGYND
jgi:hypothetical protein